MPEQRWSAVCGSCRFYFAHVLFQVCKCSKRKFTPCGFISVSFCFFYCYSEWGWASETVGEVLGLRVSERLLFFRLVSLLFKLFLSGEAIFRSMIWWPCCFRQWRCHMVGAWWVWGRGGDSRGQRMLENDELVHCRLILSFIKSLAFHPESNICSGLGLWH